MDSQFAKNEATRVTLLGMWLDLFLGVGKIIGGIITQSFALITDGIHSLTDAVTDIFVVIVARLAHTDADAEHQYGHGRFETLGTIAMGVVFFITAAILLYDSINRLRTSETIPTPAIAGIAFAALSIAAKEWIFQYTIRVARRLNSSLLKANVWHSRSDAISSIAVLIGIIGARQGYVWMDTVAAMFVAMIIAKIGWKLCADSLTELVDTAVSPQRRKQFEDCILSIEGILEITDLRSRSSGGKVILEARLLVDSHISVSEGHQLGEQASKALIKHFSDITEVLIHIDPIQHITQKRATDDAKNLPVRAKVINTLHQNWHELLDDEAIASVNLHYLGNSIEVDLVINADEFSNTLAEELQLAVQTIPYISRLRIFNKLYESNTKTTLS